MADRFIPISRKQSQAISDLSASLTQTQNTLRTVLSTLIASDDRDIPEVGQFDWRLDAKDGVFALVLALPDEKPQEQAEAKADGG
jgi:hypothetical protein